MTHDVLVCTTTQMALLPAARRTMYRLADPKYGPLQPRRRPAGSAADRGEWNRFDLAGERTIYAASTEEGAYAERIQPLKHAAPIPASELFDDADEGETVEESIAHDFAAAGHPPPHTIDLEWLYKLRMYTLQLPEHGWLVHAEHSNSVAYLHRNRPPAVAEAGLSHVTVSVLRSEMRKVTTHLAEVMAKPQLHDDSRAIGMLYGSKMGSDWDCWTVWLRDGIEDQISADVGRPVQPPASNPSLSNLLAKYGLTAL